MVKWLPQALGLAGLAGALVAAQDSARQTFRGGANVVLVDAYPTKDGRIIEGLTARDFEVLEDGRPQRIDTVEFVRVAANAPEAERRDPSGLSGMYAEAANPMNRVFVAFLDTPHVGLEGGIVARGPLVKALDGLIGRDDLFGVMTPNLRTTDLTLGRRRQSVEEQLSRYWTWGQARRVGPDLNDSIESDLQACFHTKVVEGGTVEWLIDDGPVRRFFDDVLIERRREDRTFTSLENLVEHLGAIRETRSIVVALSNGWTLVPERRDLTEQPFKQPPDIRFGRIRTLAGRPEPGDNLRNRPLGENTLRASPGSDSRLIQGCYLELQRLAVLDHPRRLRDLVIRAARNNVSIFPVALGGLVATEMTASERVLTTGSTKDGTVLSRDRERVTGRVQALRTVAENTGGTAIVNTNDIGSGVAALASQLSAYYLISYSPANATRDGRFRRIQVRTNIPGATIHARAGYVADEALPAIPGAPVADRPNAATAAVESALGELGRARSSNDLTTTAIVDGLTIATVVELGAGFRSSGWSTGALVEAEIVDATGATIGRASGNVVAGTRSTVVRIAVGASTGPWRVRARVTGPRVMQDVVTVAAKPAVMLGEALVYRGTSSPRSPIYGVADLLFTRTERLRVVWPVVDIPDSTVARLLDRQGRPLPGTLSAVPGTDDDNRAVVTVDLLLGPLSEGDYLVEMRAVRGGTEERRLQAFRVVR